jgi:hypothetical protein
LAVGDSSFTRSAIPVMSLVGIVASLSFADIRPGSSLRTQSGLDVSKPMKGVWPYCSLWQATQMAACEYYLEEANMSYEEFARSCFEHKSGSGASLHTD